MRVEIWMKSLLSQWLPKDPFIFIFLSWFIVFQVAGLFGDASIGNAINVVVVRLILLEQDEVKNKRSKKPKQNPNIKNKRQTLARRLLLTGWLALFPCLCALIACGGQDDLKITHHADNSLHSFCKWQKKLNMKGDDHPLHHDVSVLLTRWENLAQVWFFYDCSIQQGFFFNDWILLECIMFPEKFSCLQRCPIVPLIVLSISCCKWGRKQKFWRL